MTRYVRARPDPPDRRFNPRCVTNVRGQIILPDGNRHPCLVRDISLDGARLVLDRPLDLSHEFSLAVGARGRPYPVRLVWFHDRQVGIVKSLNRNI